MILQTCIEHRCMSRPKIPGSPGSAVSWYFRLWNQLSLVISISFLGYGRAFRDPLMQHQTHLTQTGWLSLQKKTWTTVNPFPSLQLNLNEQILKYLKLCMENGQIYTWHLSETMKTNNKTPFISFLHPFLDYKFFNHQVPICIESHPNLEP